jgi:hypothetical protein
MCKNPKIEISKNSRNSKNLKKSRNLKTFRNLKNLKKTHVNDKESKKS